MMKTSSFQMRLLQIMNERHFRQVDVVERANLYKMTHEEFSSVIIGKNDLSQYLSRGIEPGQDKLRLLVRVLGVTEDWIRGYDAPKTPFDLTLSALDFVLDYTEDGVQVGLDDLDPSVRVAYTAEQWDSLTLNNDVQTILLDVQAAVKNGQVGNNRARVSSRAERVGVLYDRANNRDRTLVDTVLNPYEDEVPLLADTPRVVSFPKPKVKKRKDGMVEFVVFEDQLPAAGIGSYFDTPRSHVEQYPAQLVPSGTTFGVPIGGNSMEPEYKNHATAFVQSAPRVENGEVGLFSLNGEPYVKQLVVDEEKHEVRLHSLNPIYPDIVVHEFDDLRTFGKVLGSYPT